MSKFLVGSRYFFSCYDDFTSKDTDEVEIIDTDEFKHVRQLSGRGKCHFIYKRQQSKESYIEWDIHHNVGMSVGKYLVPEFAEEIDLHVEDLHLLAPVVDRLDPKHMYEKIIYDSYIENGSFTLTPEQRDAAYDSYKSTRRPIHS